MQEAKHDWDEIDKILLVGGMTRMPMVREMVSQLTKAPVIDDVNPDEAVANGAAIQAILSLLEEEKVSGEQVLPTIRASNFSARRRADPGNRYHFPHPWRCAVGRSAPGGIRVPDDPQNDARFQRVREEFLRHRQREHAACGCPRGGRREHVAGRMHAARDL